MKVKNLNDIVNNIYGSWKVIEYNEEESRLFKRSIYTCECIYCGKLKFVRRSNFRDKPQICLCQSRQDLTGQIFNKYKVTSYAKEESEISGTTKYFCECLVCGSIDNLVIAANLKNGNSKSCCGTKKHGGYKEREYHILLDMINRCYRENHFAYKNYGARGITVCDRWLEPDGRGYINFRNDMGYRPTDKHTLERIDNNKGYSPENCKWTTYQIQNQNKRTNTVTYEEVLDIRWDREYNGLSHQQLADKYDKKIEQIGKICRYQTWDNVGDDEFDIINSDN